MRQALFAVMLVAASFAGGAVVNGPGLRWAQDHILNRLGLDGDENETDAETAPPTLVGAEVDPHAQIPASPIPPLTTVSSMSANTPASPSAPANAPRKADTRAAASSRTPASTPTPASAAEKAAEDRDEGVTLPSLEVTQVPALERPGSSNLPESNEKPSTANVNDPAVALASLGGQAPAEPDTKPVEPPAEAPEPSPAQAPAAEKPAPAAEKPTPVETQLPPTEPADWSEIRRSLGELGVSRYGMEGEPGGRVRFHCVIPLAGRRAVGQHFEAEGDDEFQAARAALRRIALWRATEASEPATGR